MTEEIPSLNDINFQDITNEANLLEPEEILNGMHLIHFPLVLNLSLFK